MIIARCKNCTDLSLRVHYFDTGKRGEESALKEEAPLRDASYKSVVSNLRVSQTLDYLGTGWDNLRNLHTAPVLRHTFDNCQTTPEGYYFIPDNVAVPVQQTEFDQMSEFHESFASYFQSITDTINVDASFHFFSQGIFGASGSYSEKHQRTKMEMATISSNVFSTKMKAHSYSLLANPDSGLNPVFKERLLEIVSHLRNNLTLRAMYEAQLVIRDYGTHYISRAELGAITEQLLYVNRDFNYRSEKNLDEMKATASAGFQGLYWGGSASASTGRIVNDEMKTRLSTMTRHVRINTQGGPSAQRIASCRMSENKTCVGAIDNLVALDHQGEPLFTLVSTHLLKELHPVEVYKLSDLIKTAIIEYYKMNTIPGCTDPKDINFNFQIKISINPLQANINDGTCNGTGPPVPAFGGVFQICELIETAPRYRCDQFTQRNSITGDFSCPQGHHPELVADFVYAGFEDRVVDIVHKDCDDWFFWEDCDTYVQHVVYKDKVRLRSYSCAPTVPSNSTDPGYLFGGPFSKGQPNLWTRGETCPPYYFPAKIAGEVNVCLSRDMEMGEPYKEEMSISAHLATITANQCEVYYCIRTGVYKRFELAQIKRPPFLNPEVKMSNISTHYVRYFVNNQLLIAYPLQVVIDQQIKNGDERRDYLANVSPDDINTMVAKWIQHKLKERSASSGKGSWISSGWLAFGMMMIVVIVLSAWLAITFYHSKRRPHGQELLLHNDAMQAENA